ncbi:hypothetical protein PVK06_021953 [Gossypium arboreum]|uniref:Uncharacterized protein n=1 Tax=Gossypium arboreum TaxID=29729 RepID=A0ABR0PS04_GOSAR|nr:hypothetical protein PVK06_021953 [Gossypium arboreum]
MSVPPNKSLHHHFVPVTNLLQKLRLSPTRPENDLERTVWSSLSDLIFFIGDSFSSVSTLAFLFRIPQIR